MVREGWRKIELGRVIEVKHGFAFKGKFFRDEPSGDILLTPGNFAIGGGFKRDKFKYYNGLVPEEFVLNEGDLLVTMTDLSRNADTLGYPAIIPAMENGRRFLHNQRLGKILILDERCMNKRFLYYLFCFSEYRNDIVAGATGTTVKHTSPNRIKAYNATIPPIKEQQAIACILGALDDKIELNRRMNRTLEEMARALFKSWFVDFEPVRYKAAGQPPPGLAPDIAALFPDSFEDSELGEIPKRWGASTIGQHFRLIMGQSPPGSTYNEIGEGLPFYQGRTDFGFRFPKRRVYCTVPTRFAEPGDTLVSVRAPVGDVNMANELCAIGRGVAAIRHHSGFKSFTYYLIRHFREHFMSFEAEGTVFGCINKGDFERLPFIVPPIEIINAFELNISPLDDKIECNEYQSSTLISLRDALLPKLISGELRVPDAERIVGRCT
jgi:type I restriction enzyme S subunit